MPLDENPLDLVFFLTHFLLPFVLLSIRMRVSMGQTLLILIFLLGVKKNFIWPLASTAISIPEPLNPA